MTSAVAAQVRRLLEARTAAEGRRLGWRLALGTTGALVVAVAVHRLLRAVPPLLALERRPLTAVLAVAAALPAALLAGRAWALARRPGARALAWRLDDALETADAVDAALTLEGRTGDGPLCALVERRAAARLTEVDPAALWRSRRATLRAPVALGALALLLLLAPGVLGAGPGSGAGAGTGAGVGRREDPSEPRSGSAPAALDADRWLREHARLALEVPDPSGAWNRWVGHLTTDAPLPAPLAGDLSVLVDGKGPIGPAARADAPAGAPADERAAFRGDADARAKALLTPGRHEVVARFTPRSGPWRQSVDSPPIEVVVPPPQDGGPKDPPPPPPRPPPPQPPPPPPPPTPPPPEPPPPSPPPPPVAAPPPEASFHDEVVDPLDREGERVRKEKAVVAVRDPDAGSAPPKEVPLAQALADLERVVERAVAGERLRPSDREFVRRYLEALRRAAGVR